MRQKRFRTVLQEVTLTLNAIQLFNVLLSTAIVFCLFFPIYSVLNLNPLLSLYPAISYFLITMLVRLSSDKLRAVESAYPQLDEMLQTARDYIGIDNPFIPSLQEDIRARLSSVETGRFFSTAKTWLKGLMVVVLCFLILTLVPYHIVWVDAESAISKLVDRLPHRPSAERQVQRLTSIDGAWYGEYRIANLSQDEDLEVTIVETNYKVISGAAGAVEDKAFKDQSYAAGFDPSPEDLYTTSIVKKDQDIVRNYFTQISRS